MAQPRPPLELRRAQLPALPRSTSVLDADASRVWGVVGRLAWSGNGGEFSRAVTDPRQVEVRLRQNLPIRSQPAHNPLQLASASGTKVPETPLELLRSFQRSRGATLVADADASLGGL